MEEHSALSYKLNWYIESRVILVQVSGTVDEASIVSLNDALLQSLNQGEPLVHIIVDGRGITSFQVTLARLRQVSKVLEHSALGWVITISPNRMLTFLASMVTQVLRKTRYRSVASVEQAITLLQQRDPTIDWTARDERMQGS